jgi:hypothetical protein
MFVLFIVFYCSIHKKNSSHHLFWNPVLTLFSNINFQNKDFRACLQRFLNATVQISYSDGLLDSTNQAITFFELPD